MTRHATESLTCATSLALPTTVADFFATLSRFGRIVGVSESAKAGVTLYLPGDDPEGRSLGQRLLLLAQALGAQGHAPAFPTGPGMSPAFPSYRWTFDTPTYAGNGEWAVLVPNTADVLYLLGAISGVGAYPQTYRGEPVLPVTLHPEDKQDLHETVSSLQSELQAWFGVPVSLTAPRTVA